MSWLPEEAREMLDALVAFMKRLGRDPTFMEAKAEPSLPEPNDYAYYFGSFTEAVKDAHRKALVYKEQPKIAKATSVIRIFTEEEEELMSRRAITDEEYVVSALRLQKELGHFPNISELRKDFRAPSPQSYERRFGGDWNTVKACIRKKATELGITEDNFETIIEEHPELFEPKKEKAVAKPVEEEKSQLAPSEEDRSEPVAEAAFETAQALESEPIPEAAPETEQIPEPEPAPEAESSTVIQPDELLDMSLDSEPLLPEEIDLQKVKLISLLPKTRIANLKISGYGLALKMQGSIPLPKSISGIPISKKHTTLQFIQSGQVKEFPAIRDDVFYIVDRGTALAARETGREVYDLLIPEKYDKDDDTMTVHEFSII